MARQRRPRLSKCVRSDGDSAEFFSAVSDLYRDEIHCDLNIVCGGGGGGGVVRCHTIVIVSVLPPRSRLRRFLLKHVSRTTTDDGGGAYLSVPDSSYLEMRNAVDAVYRALAAAGGPDVDAASLLSVLEQSIGIEGKELSAFLPEKELRIVLPRLKLEELDDKGVLDIKPKIDIQEEEEGEGAVKEFDLNFLQSLNNALDVEIAKVEEKDVQPGGGDNLYSSEEEFGHSPAASYAESDNEWEPESKRALFQEPVVEGENSTSVFENIKRLSDDHGTVVAGGDEEKGKAGGQCPCCSYATKDLSNLRRHVNGMHAKDEIEGKNNRKRKAFNEDVATAGKPEKKRIRGRPRKSEQNPKSKVRERVLTAKDEELFSFATKRSADGATVVVVGDYDALGGVRTTAKHLVTEGGTLTGVPANGPFVVGRGRRQKKSSFCALAALSRVPGGGGSDGAFEAIALASSYPESEDDLEAEFGRVWAVCKAAFGCSDRDVAAEFMALWRQPNFLNTASGRSQVRCKNYLVDLKQSVIKGLRQKLYGKTEEQLRKNLEEAETALKTSVTLCRGEPRALALLSQPRIDIEFVPAHEIRSFHFEALVFLEWRHGGLVTYSSLEPDCFQTRSLSGAVYDTWRSERLPVGKGVAKRFEDALRPTELVKEIELALKRGGRTELCPDCGIAVHRTKFAEHRRWHLENEDTACPECSKKFDSKFKMLKHAYNQKHIPDLERCNHCEKFGSKSEMAKHMEESHRETYICDVCGKEWKNRNRYEQHKLTHKEFKCDKCGATVIGNKRWWEHKQEHAGNLSHPCQDCSYVGKFLHNLKAHRREVHTRDEDKQFQCQFCGKGFSVKGKLMDHVETVHEKARSYVCDYGCGSAYNDKSTLRQHMERRHGHFVNKMKMPRYQSSIH